MGYFAVNMVDGWHCTQMWNFTNQWLHGYQDQGSGAYTWLLGYKTLKEQLCAVSYSALYLCVDKWRAVNIQAWSY